MPRDDAQWLEQLRGGSQRDDASRALHDFLRGTLARGFGRQLSDADLDDFTQQAVMRTIERIEDFRGDSRFTTWAASIAVNLALGELRRRRHGGESLEAIVDRGRATLARRPAAPDHLQEQDAARVLEEAIAVALTDAQREALHAELGGMTLMEIARRTGRTRGALYKLMHDARKRLRAHLSAQGVTAADLLPSSSGGEAR